MHISPLSYKQILATQTTSYNLATSYINHPIFIIVPFAPIVLLSTHLIHYVLYVYLYLVVKYMCLHCSALLHLFLAVVFISAQVHWE